MDKKKSIINVLVSISFKIVILISTLLVRRFLIKYIGNEANGLNSLYLSIIGFLAVAELGVGSAITFCMYKPILEGDNAKVSALYQLFTKLYWIIGAIIVVAGVIVIPFIPYLAKDYDTIAVNLYSSFALMLISVVLTYLYSSKSSLITAHKNDYITTTITSISTLIQNGLQIIVLVITGSFELYLGCRIIAVLVQWILTEIVSRKKYGNIIKDKQKIDSDTKQNVIKNVKAMFMHKIGGLLVNTTDSIIISAFIGVVLLGKYSNYVIIITSMTGIISLFFTPLTAIIGHMCAKNCVEEEKKYFNFFYVFNFIIGTIFFLGYYAIVDDLVLLFFGPSLELDTTVKIVITINYFIQYMRQTVHLFRDASGTFYNDRWKPLFEGSINIVLSIILVQIIGISGVILATICTNLLICHVVEPYVLFKNEFKESPKKYYIKNYLLMALFVMALMVFTFINLEFENTIINLLVNGFIAVGISIIPCAVVILFSKEFRYYLKRLWNKISKKQVL